MVDFLRFLMENSNSRKIFGKRELKIIEKQLNGVNLTQSEKNRLSRNIRKKLEFIKEAARFEGEFELKKGKITKEIINKTIEAIKHHKLFSRVEKIILFGSLAENRFHLFSDIDIAVKFNKIDLKEATKFRINISGDAPDKVDIQVYNVLPDKIKREIDKNGKIIFQRKD